MMILVFLLTKVLEHVVNILYPVFCPIICCLYHIVALCPHYLLNISQDQEDAIVVSKRKEEMIKEMSALKKNGTWELVPLP